MKKNILVVLLVSVGLFLTACSDKPDFTATSLLENPEELKKQNERCKKMSPEKAAQDEACQIVKKANNMNMMKDYPKRGERTSAPPKATKLPGM